MSPAHYVEFVLDPDDPAARTPVRTMPVRIAAVSGVQSSSTGAPNPASLATRQLLLLEHAVAKLRKELAERGLLDASVRL